MTSAYRRDHEPFPANDEFARLNDLARQRISTKIVQIDILYPTPVASEGEVRALERAMARYLIDSGKASAAGAV